MKFFIASDIHGAAKAAEKMKDMFEKEDADRLILLGDLLYHGPRNDIPADYDTRKTTEILNSLSDRIIWVRGNCDSEVDEMVLDFPVIPAFVLDTDGKLIFFTHGHVFNRENLPYKKFKDILVSGHTHIGGFDYGDEALFINPGSIGIPKDGTCGSYLTLSKDTFTLKDLDGKIIRTVTVV